MSIVLAITAWLAFSGVATAGTRTYEVSSVQMKTKAATSAWPPFKDGRPRGLADIARLETVDGRWALETSGSGDEKDEGWLYGRFVDSTGNVIWEDTVGYANYLSTTLPAFVTSSPFWSDIKFYNLELDQKPLMTFADASMIARSPDGTAFAVKTGPKVTLVSFDGTLLGSFHVQNPDRGLPCTALSESGRYLAFGELEMGVVRSPSQDAPNGGTGGSDSARARHPRDRRPPHGDTTYRNQPQSFVPAPPGRLREEVVHQGCSAYDRAGHIVLQFTIPSSWPLLRFVAISDTDPPKVAVATDRSVSVWAADGQMVWEDSSNSGGFAMYFTRDQRLLSLAGGAPSTRTLRVWDTVGRLETQLTLPSTVMEGARSIELIKFVGDSLRIETNQGTVVVRWSIGTK